MKLFIGADHNGFEMKTRLIAYLQEKGYEIYDVGATEFVQTDDFPQFASKVVSDLLNSTDKDAKGILLCGSGQGMSIAANRYKGIRASLVWNIEEAKLARNDNDCNILCLPTTSVDDSAAIPIVDAWLTTPFAAAPRFVRRISEMDKMG